MDWSSILTNVSGGLLGPLGDLLFGGLASLEKAGVAGWVEDNYGGLSKAESQSFDRQLSNSTQLQAQQYNYNSALMERQYAMQEEFYQKYQSPEAMVNQYRTAGLNPALMFGQGASASGGQGTSISPQGVTAPAAGGSASGIIGLMSAIGDIKSSFSQAALNFALAHKAEGEAKNLPFLRGLTEAQTNWYNQQSDESKARIQNIGKQNEKIAQEILKLCADTKLSAATSDKIITETEIMSAKFGSELTLLQESIKKVKAEVANLDEDTQLKKYQEILTDSQSFKTLNEGQYYNQMSELTSSKVSEQLYLNAFVLPLQEALVQAGIDEKTSQKLLNDASAALTNEKIKYVYDEVVTKRLGTGITNRLSISPRVEEK